MRFTIKDIKKRLKEQELLYAIATSPNGNDDNYEIGELFGYIDALEWVISCMEGKDVL